MIRRCLHIALIPLAVPVTVALIVILALLAACLPWRGPQIDPED